MSWSSLCCAMIADAMYACDGRKKKHC
jgi:hypothetical protein